MARITCEQPSTGRPLNFTAANVGTSYAVLAEAPDFSVPDLQQVYPVRDPASANRAIRAGEVFLVTPLMARNKSASAAWIEARLLLESGAAIECPGRVRVEAGDTVMIPVQGRSLMKRAAASAAGDRLQVRAETANVFDVWVSGEERLAAEHGGVAA